MAKFVVLYTGGMGMAATPEEQEKIMAEWGAWYGMLGEAIVDGGAPFGAAKNIASAGSIADGPLSDTPATVAIRVANYGCKQAPNKKGNRSSSAVIGSNPKHGKNTTIDHSSDPNGNGSDQAHLFARCCRHPGSMAVSNCRADLPECLPELPGQLRSATAKNKAWDVGHSHQDHSDCRNSVTRAVIDGPGPLQPEVNRKDRFMKKASIIVAITALAALGVATAASAASGNPGGFEHAPIISVDGEAYYSAGAPDGPDGATDIPGHYWKQAGPNQLVGKHYNTGPFGTPSWWSSDAPDGELLYTVHGIIDTWSPETAKAYADRGYKHYHELLSVADGTLHPTKVMWLKHTAVATFTLDGGPMPSFGHDVTPGIDVAFIPNGMTPYNP